MLLAIDIGNTNITIGGFDGDELVFVTRLATDRSRTPDQYAVEFKQIFSLYEMPCNSFEGAAISSVVPELSGAMSSAVERVTGCRPMILGPGIKTARQGSPGASGFSGTTICLISTAFRPAPKRIIVITAR